MWHWPLRRFEIKQTSQLSCVQPLLVACFNAPGMQLTSFTELFVVWANPARYDWVAPASLLQILNLRRGRNRLGTAAAPNEVYNTYILELNDLLHWSIQRKVLDNECSHRIVWWICSIYILCYHLRNAACSGASRSGISSWSNSGAAYVRLFELLDQ